MHAFDRNHRKCGLEMDFLIEKESSQCGNSVETSLKLNSLSYKLLSMNIGKYQVFNSSHISFFKSK